MRDSLKASQKGLQIVKDAGRKKGWKQTVTQEWWSRANTTQATLKRFWRCLPIDGSAFRGICKAVGVNWKEVADLNEIQETELPGVSTTSKALSAQNLNFVDREEAASHINNPIDPGARANVIQAIGSVDKTTLGAEYLYSQVFDWAVELLIAKEKDNDERIVVPKPITPDKSGVRQVEECNSLELAIAANNRGFDYYVSGDLIQAQEQFLQAIKKNPNHAASYYNLAWIYERIGDFPRAIEFYRKAALRGFAAAYCNLVRLHIIGDKNYRLAVEICWQGLRLVEEEKVESDKIVKAALFTYLAWAWMEQGRYEEALEKLREALELEPKRSSARALFAQVLEKLGNWTEALEAWRIYLNDYARPNERDEDIWIGMARQRLKEPLLVSSPHPNSD